MTYATNYATAVDASFTGRVFMAIRDAARDVINENPGTANHANRILLAKLVVRSTPDWASTFAYRLAELGSTTATSDADLKTAVASVWDSMLVEAYWS